VLSSVDGFYRSLHSTNLDDLAEFSSHDAVSSCDCQSHCYPSVQHTPLKLTDFVHSMPTITALINSQCLLNWPFYLQCSHNRLGRSPKVNFLGNCCGSSFCRLEALSVAHQRYLSTVGCIKIPYESILIQNFSTAVLHFYFRGHLLLYCWP